MTPADAVAYLGPALIYAALMTLGWLALASALPFLPRPGSRAQLSLLLILFFLILTQYPFPEPETLDCSTGGAQPLWWPFSYLDHVHRLWRQSKPLSVWLQDRVILGTALNFVLCAVIGLALARHVGGRRPWTRVAVLAVLLSGGAELTQLTATFGFYPCPYRYFETSDLINNIGGILAGFWLGRRAWGAQP
jgi:hypothetical protein